MLCQKSAGSPYALSAKVFAGAVWSVAGTPVGRDKDVRARGFTVRHARDFGIFRAVIGSAFDRREKNGSFSTNGPSYPAGTPCGFPPSKRTAPRKEPV
jgi:hypothetical protein